MWTTSTDGADGWRVEAAVFFEEAGVDFAAAFDFALGFAFALLAALGAESFVFFTGGAIARLEQHAPMTPGLHHGYDKNKSWDPERSHESHANHVRHKKAPVCQDAWQVIDKAS